MYDPVPADAVPLCCPRCRRVLGHTTRVRVYAGGMCWDEPTRLPCRYCRFSLRWRPVPGNPPTGVDSLARPVHTNG